MRPRVRLPARLLLLAPVLLMLGGCLAATAIAYAAHDADPLVAVTLAERQFALRAQTDGQWTAFRATAAPDAIMFVPDRVAAQAWLAGRADPPRSVAWQPHAVYVSCDGTLAATSGAAQWPGGTHGRFTTIWRRGDHGWRWIADAGGRVDAPIPAPPRIVQRRARCAGHAPSPAAADPASPGEVSGGGAAADGSLVWRYRLAANGALRLSVDLRDGDRLERVIDDLDAGV